VWKAETIGDKSEQWDVVWCQVMERPTVSAEVLARDPEATTWNGDDKAEKVTGSDGCGMIEIADDSAKTGAVNCLTNVWEHQRTSSFLPRDRKSERRQRIHPERMFRIGIWGNYYNLLLSLTIVCRTFYIVAVFLPVSAPDARAIGREVTIDSQTGQIWPSFRLYPGLSADRANSWAQTWRIWYDTEILPTKLCTTL
jgi:hypothetical protein